MVMIFIHPNPCVFNLASQLIIKRDYKPTLLLDLTPCYAPENAHASYECLVLYILRITFNNIDAFVATYV